MSLLPSVDLYLSIQRILYRRVILNMWYINKLFFSGTENDVRQLLKSLIKTTVVCTYSLHNKDPPVKRS